MNCFFARGRVNTDVERTEPLHVNNCGFYRDTDTPLRIERPRGRGDYQIIVCLRGRIDANGEALERGDAYLFLPNKPQSYCYHPSPNSHYFWIHFGGVKAEEVLRQAGLLEGVYRCRTHISELESLLRLMETFPRLGGENGEALGRGLLYSILMLLPNANAPKSPFSYAVKRLENFEAPVTIEELAEHYRMSEAHFIRLFGSYFGMPPKRYRRVKQIEIARMLLDDSPLSVSQIAARVGFEDALYFSRAFKEITGVSPTAYRKR